MGKPHIVMKIYWLEQIIQIIYLGLVSYCIPTSCSLSQTCKEDNIQIVFSAKTHIDHASYMNSYMSSTTQNSIAY